MFHDRGVVPAAGYCAYTGCRQRSALHRRIRGRSPVLPNLSQNRYYLVNLVLLIMLVASAHSGGNASV